MDPLAVINKEPAIRILPHNTEAEQSLLGTLMLNNEYFESVSESILPEYFYTPIHGEIYEVIRKLISQQSIADPITLKSYFEQKDELQKIAGGKYLIQLVNSVVSIAGVGDYAKLIHDMYLRRQLIIIGECISYNAAKFELNVSAADLMEGAETKLYELSASDNRGGFITFSDALANTIEIAEKAYKKSSVTGVTSGFVDLDKKLLGGLNKSDLIILAGRPSMGKTALATNIAFNAAMAYEKKIAGGGRVAFFSLEMSHEQLITRILSNECEIPSEKIKRGEINESDFSKLVGSNKMLAKLPLLIDDAPALSISAVRTRSRKLKRQYGLDLIVIDYLQLLRVDLEKRYENRVQEISEITRSLKALAKELNVPVLALSQLSRAVEARDDKHPQLSDLRESGSIEQDADVVMFVYREEYYQERNQPVMDTDEHKKWLNKMSKVHNLAEIILAKQRHGPVGVVPLFFDNRYVKFDNLSDSRKIHYD